MKTRLEPQLEELYKRPLGEFTQARNTLAKTLSGADKKQVSSLVKPTLPMWIVNQLYWQDAPTYRALADASEKLRAAHRAALGGRKIDTRTPDQLYRTTVEKAFAKAVGIAEKKGVRATDTVRDAVRRTLMAIPTEEPPGRMTREPAAVGFSLLTGIKPRPIEKPKPPSAAQKAAERTSERDRKEAERRAKEEERKAQKERERREREIQKAERMLREAERRLASLRR
jgi:hypothetical protein